MKRGFLCLFVLFVAFSIALVPVFAGGGKEKAEKKKEVEVTTTGEWSLAKAAEPYKGTVLHITKEPWAAPEAYIPIIKDFEAKTGIKVEIEKIEVAEAETKILADFQAKTHNYDMLDVIPENLMKYKTLGMFEPMDKYMENKALRDPTLSFDNVPKILLQSFTLDGVLYAWPLYVVQSFGIYRKDIAENKEEQDAFLKKYGYKLKFPPETPEKYLDICEFFTRKAGEKLAGKLLDRDFYGTTVAFKRGWWTSSNYIKFEVPFGGRIYDKKGNVTINTPANLTALEFMLNLRKYCPPGYLEYTWDEQVNQYINGNVFMYDSWTDTFPYIEDQKESKVAGLNGYFRPAVWGQGGRSAEGVFKGVAILSTSKNKEAAYLLIQYFQRPEVQKKYQSLGGTSFNFEVLKAPEFYDKIPYIPVLVDMLEDPKALEPVVGWPWIWEAYEELSGEINKAAADEVSAKQALENMQLRAEKIAAGK